MSVYKNKVKSNKCPKCASMDVSPLDGSDVIKKERSPSVQICLEICPDMYICHACKHTFTLNEAEGYETENN